MQEQEFSPGFRMNKADRVVLLLMLVFVVALPALLPHAIGEHRITLLWGSASTVFAAFFLFCNVFRVRRSLELSWAAVFIAIVAVSFERFWPSGLATLALGWIGIATVVVIEMCTSSYHGYGWRLINPGLADWWARRNSRTTRPRKELP